MIKHVSPELNLASSRSTLKAAAAPLKCTGGARAYLTRLLRWNGKFPNEGCERTQTSVKHTKNVPENLTMCLTHLFGSSGGLGRQLLP